SSCVSIFCFHFTFIAPPESQPFHMVVHRIAWRRTCRKRFEVLLRSLQCPLNACIDVVTLLKVYVFKEVAADRSGGNRIAVHLDSLHMRNHPFHRHQPLAQIFIDTWGVVSFCHKRIPEWSELALVVLSEDTRMRHFLASRLLYFGIDLFWSVPPWPNQQQIGPMHLHVPSPL